jgi:hypothetical protein
MAASNYDLPVSVAAYLLALSYGQALRLVQQRQIAGEYRDGHWYTSAAAVHAFDNNRVTVPEPSPAAAT